MEKPVSTDWGAYGQLFAGWHEAGLHAASRCLVAQALSRQLRGRPVGGGRRREEVHAAGDDDYKGNYLWPMYGRNGEIYFVADRMPNEKGVKFGGPEVMKSVNNIWKISEKGGKPVQVTHHTSGNLFFPSISADGKTIVYEENFGLWKLDVASGKSTEIRVDIKSDAKENEAELVTIKNEARGLSLVALQRGARRF